MTLVCLQDIYCDNDQAVIAIWYALYLYQAITNIEEL